MGQKVIGIDSVEYHSYYDNQWLWRESDTPMIGECHDVLLSNQLEAPLKKESESKEVVWLIE